MKRARPDLQIFFLRVIIEIVDIGIYICYLRQQWVFDLITRSLTAITDLLHWYMVIANCFTLEFCL